MMADRPAPNPPLVSVLVPAYNAAGNLQHTLDSLLAQTYPHWEAVVVDDGSVDDTAAVLARQTDPRIRTVRQANAGIVGARNRTFAEARGELLAFLDADDLAEPQRLATQVAYLASHPDVDLCCAAFTAFDEHGPLPADFARSYYPILQQMPQGWASALPEVEDWACETAGASRSVRAYSGSGYRWLVHGNFIHPPTIVFRRRVLARVGGMDPAAGCLPEWDWFVRFARQGRMAYLDVPLLRYRRHADQLTGPRHVLRVARDVIAVSEKICRDDPAIHAADREWFERDLGAFHRTMANILANTDAPAALRALGAGLRHDASHLQSALFVVAKALTPAPVLRRARQLRQALHLHAAA